MPRKRSHVCIDYVLPPAKAVEAAQLAIRENPANLPRPRRPATGAASLNSPLRMALEAAKRWKPGRTLGVAFFGGSPVLHDKVKKYAAEWMNFANLKLEFGTNSNAEIRVAFVLDGSSWSTVGTDALTVSQHEATMNYGWLEDNTPEDEFSRVVLHEFGHALACIHEHQHPEAGINWDRERVYQTFSGPPNNWTREEIDFNILNRYNRNQTQYSEFDPASIMLYGFPAELTSDGIGTNWNTVLSAKDKHFIGTQYPAGKPEVRQLQVGGAPLEESIAVPGERDVFELTITKAGRYVLSTSGGTDVVMTLFGPNTLTDLVAEDDDSGQGTNARLRIDLEPGTYYLRIRHYNPTATGKYGVMAKAA